MKVITKTYVYGCSCAGREHEITINAKSFDIAENILIDITRFPADWELKSINKRSFEVSGNNKDAVIENIKEEIKNLKEHQLPHTNYSENNIHKAVTLTEINSLEKALKILEEE